MEHLNTIVLAIVVVGSGWFVGRMMVGFVDFVSEYIKRQDRDE